MVALATRTMLGRKLKELGYQGGLHLRQNLVAVKAPVFSMAKLTGVDSYLGPEMRSTGEVMGLDYDVYAAMAKALLAAGLNLPTKGDILLSIADTHKAEAAPLARSLAECGYGVYATSGTASFLRKEGLANVKATNKLGQGTPNVEDIIRSGQVQAVVNTVSEGHGPIRDGFYIRRAAVEKRIPCYTSLDTLHAAVEVLRGSEARYNVKRRTEYLDPSG